MRIDKITVEEIKSRIDIVDVIGDFLQLKRTGQNYKANSPFSDEKTPSFFVFPKNENFKDFSSGKQGDAISFIMEYDGLSYTDALLYLAKKYGIEVKEEEQSPEALQLYNERESLYIILNFAKEFYKNNLWESQEGKDFGLTYFRERGFPDEILNKFELGYSLEQWDALEKEAVAKGYNADLLEKGGLLIRKDDKQYDRFRGRVIFPIHNSTGKTIAFGARILKSRENQPKYLNSPETEVYHKSNILYGLFQARRAIRSQDNCYLVEGYTDVLSLHQHGVENVVASSGTSLTENQIKLIQRHTENITVLFDGDEAGIKASLRGIDMILSQGMNVRALVFPENEDPDSYSRKLGTMGFREFLKDNTQDFIQFKTKLLLKEGENDPIKKAGTINQIISSIVHVTDPVKRAIYIQQTSALLEMDEQVLYAELNKILIGRSRDKQKTIIQKEDIPVEDIEPKEETQVLDSIFFQEKEAIRILINYGFNKIENEYNLYEHYFEELTPVEFSYPIYNEILNIFKAELQKNNIIDAEFLMKNGSEEIKNEVIDLISNKYEISENWEKRYRIFVPGEVDVLGSSVFSNILRIKFRKIKKLIELNKEELKNESDPDKQTELLKIHMELKKAEASFAKPLGIVVS